MSCHLFKKLLPSLFLSLLLLLFFYTPAHAVYKCALPGSSITYSDQPCNGQELTLENAKPSSESANEKRLAKEQAELTRLQNLRELRERQDQQYRQMTLRGHAAKQKKCRALELQKKWKEEDVTIALPPAQTKARLAARRANEKYQMECS